MEGNQARRLRKKRESREESCAAIGQSGHAKGDVGLGQKQ